MLVKRLPLRIYRNQEDFDFIGQNSSGEPMIYAQVSDDNRKQLQNELADTKDVRWYRRLKIIDLSSVGKTVPQLTEIFDLSSSTVRDYIHRYNSGGIAVLRRSYSPGRPAQFEKLNTAARNWTQELLVEYCHKYLSVEITQGRLCQILKTLGIKWNRGKLKVTSPDPLYTVKRKRIETLKKKRHKES